MIWGKVPADELADNITPELIIMAIEARSKSILGKTKLFVIACNNSAERKKSRVDIFLIK